MTRRAGHALLCWLAAGLCWLAACAPAPEEPPPLELEERNAAIEELRARRQQLEHADTGLAVELLGHDNHRVRRAAAQRLAALGPDARPAVEALVRRLDDPSSRVQTAAAIALGAIGDPRAIEPLIAALADENRKLRLWAWKGLRKFGDDAIPKLVAHMGRDSSLTGVEYVDEADNPHPLRDEIRVRLTSLGKQVVPYMIEATRSKDDLIVAEAVRILGDLGEDGVDGIPALAELLDSASAKTRKQVVFALGAIGDLDPAVIPALRKATEDNDSRVSQAAKKVLKNLEKAALEEEKKKQEKEKARQQKKAETKQKRQPAKPQGSP